MKLFGASRLFSENYKIKNSDSDLKIEFGTKTLVEWDNKAFETVKISFKGHLLTEFHKEQYNPHLFFVDVEKAKELGLIHESCENTGYSAIIDSLYYYYNPEKLRTAEGRLFVKCYDGLYQRLANNAFWYSNLTQELVAEVRAELIKEVKTENPSLDEKAPEFYTALISKLQSKGMGNRLSVSYITLEFLPTNRLSSIRISGAIRHIKPNLDPTDYGYREENGHWLHADEILWRNRVYKRTDEFITCPTCSQTVPSSGFDQEENECQECIASHYEIHSYSTRVPQLLKFKAKKVKPDTLYMGCELEFETTNKDQARVKVGKALKGHAIMKSDGSIRNGFEIVTCPATLDIQLEVFKEFFANKPNELINAANVGMHVHVSRKPLTLLSIGKMTEFMNRQDNRKFITFIAGREPNNYCGQGHRTVTFPVVNRGGGERYNALNLSNRDTVEFRIFSTPLTYEDFASKIEFCQALVDFTKPCTTGVALKAQTYFETFINWVKENHKFYPELSNKLKGFV